MLPIFLLLAVAAPPADLPVGQIIDPVACDADRSQSYALFIPSSYTADRAWPVIFALDPGGRGRSGVERYQAAAEQYGFIVAGSNNSRNNGSANGPAVLAMSGDVASRFHVDGRRVYMAGMSGGARVALGVALASPDVAGVIASSAGYPDGQRRRTLRFPIFATAGTEDFNHLEMRKLDRELTTPHHLAIFEGGHVWLSSELALEAVEWMELRAIKSGIKPRDDGEIDRIFAKRMEAIGAARDKGALLALRAVIADFEGLKDVSAQATRAAELDRDKSVRDALKKDRDEDDREERMMADVLSAEGRLGRADQRDDALLDLRARWRQLSTQAKKPEDTAERRLARRVLSGLSAGVTTTDEDYLRIIREYRIGRGGRQPR